MVGWTGEGSEEREKRRGEERRGAEEIGEQSRGEEGRGKKAATFIADVGVAYRILPSPPYLNLSNGSINTRS